MKLEEILLRAIEKPYGIKLRSDEPARLRNNLNSTARRLGVNSRISVVIPPDAPDQVWVIPKRKKKDAGI